MTTTEILPVEQPASAPPTATDDLHPALALLPEAQHDEWDDFVLTCPHGSAFQTAWWYRSWGYSPVVQALRNPKGGIVAGICYAVGNRFGTRAMVRPPCTAGNGPVFAPGGEGNYKQITHAKQMALLAVQSLPKLGFYDLRLRPQDTDVMPYLWNGFDTHTGYTYVIPASEKETWMEGASKTTRKEIRRAIRDVADQGCRIEDNPEPDQMLPLIQDTLAAKNFKVNRLEEQFAAWWAALKTRRGLRLSPARPRRRGHGGGHPDLGPAHRLQRSGRHTDRSAQ